MSESKKNYHIGHTFTTYLSTSIIRGNEDVAFIEVSREVNDYEGEPADGDREFYYLKIQDFENEENHQGVDMCLDRAEVDTLISMLTDILIKEDSRPIAQKAA